MRSTDAVYIILLHENKVTQDVLAGYGIAERGIGIVAVYALDFYRSAVYLENAALP